MFHFKINQKFLLLIRNTRGGYSLKWYNFSSATVSFHVKVLQFSNNTLAGRSHASSYFTPVETIISTEIWKEAILEGLW